MEQSCYIVYSMTATHVQNLLKPTSLQPFEYYSADKLYV